MDAHDARPLHAATPRSLGFVVPLTLSLLAASFLVGCGYTVGNGFSEEIRSVHVLVFKSDTNRRGLEYQLTEAVQKELQNRTHFRLAKPPEADTELRGRIVDVRKAVLGESAFDDPRSLQMTLAVEVSWVNLRNGQILSQQRVPIAPDLIQLLATGDFAPEVGQSLATATQESTRAMARSIVDMMEAPW